MKTLIALVGCMLLAGMAGNAAVIVYDVNLSGPNESPPNASPGTGFAMITLDTVANTMRVQVSFSNLVAGTTASHIHCCTPAPLSGTAGVATTTPTFLNFPLGVTSGTYDNTLNMLDPASYNPAFVSANGGTTAAAEAVLFAGIGAQDAYLNIHSQTLPNGEIRGFLSLAAPEPGTFLVAGIALAGLIRRRRRAA